MGTLYLPKQLLIGNKGAVRASLENVPAPDSCEGGGTVFATSCYDVNNKSLNP